MEKRWDFTASSVVALLCCVLVLIAFLFMPWIGKLATENGARLFSDYMYDAAGAKPVPLIGIIPFVIVTTTGLALWGVLDPEKGRITSPIIAVLGLARRYQQRPGNRVESAVFAFDGKRERGTIPPGETQGEAFLAVYAPEQ